MGHHLSPAWITVGQRNEWSCLMKVCFLIWYPDITRFPCPYTELAQRNPPSSNQSITNDSDLEGSDSNMETSETEQDQSDNDEDKGEDNKLLWNPPVTYWAFNEARFHYAVRHINFMYFWIESRAWGRVAIFLVGLIPEACSSNGRGVSSGHTMKGFHHLNLILAPPRWAQGHNLAMKAKIQYKK